MNDSMIARAMRAATLLVSLLISYPVTASCQSPTGENNYNPPAISTDNSYDQQPGYEPAFGQPEGAPHPKEVRALSYEEEPGYEAAFGQPNGLADPHERLRATQQTIIDAQSRQLRRVEVVTSAQVWRLLPTDNNGLRHQKFLIRLNNGTTVLVANDLTMGQMVPVQPGDVVEIKGEYIWTKRGGVLHWTHRSDSAHPSGWIRLGDQTYQ
ncbi:MAG: DUF3465 domain-containing protein [Cyanobacteria bacterium]|nr:DUF3465 domain-containing protein [Cyanobacteriota bacterium]